MKKKLFIVTLMIVVLACLLSLSVFAEETAENEVVKTESDVYGTVIRLNFDPGLDNAAQYVSELKKITDSGTDKDALCILTDGTYYYVFPSSYVVNERADGKFEIYAEALAAAMSEFNTEMKTGYYDAYAMASNDYANRRMDNIVRFEFPTDVTNISDSWCCMRKYPYLKEVRIGHAINISGANGLFQNSSALEIVVGFENVTGFDNVQSTFFSCSSLSTVNLPANTTKISTYTFKGCKKLKYTNIGELEYCTTIESNAFRDAESATVVIPDSVTTIGSEAFRSACKNGGSVTNTPNSKLVTIGANAFNDCRKMTYFYVASTVESIGDNAFYQCFNLATLENLENCQVTSLGSGVFTSISKLTSIKLPKNLTTLGAAFGGNEKLATVYLPYTITSIADTFTGTQPTNAVYIYTGSAASALSACSRLAGANVIQAKDYVSTNTYTGVNLVVGYSHCEAYGHNYVGTGDCTDGLVCACSASLGGEKEHKYYESLVYVAFDQNGVYNFGC